MCSDDRKDGPLDTSATQMPALRSPGFGKARERVDVTIAEPHAEALYRDASAPVPERVADLLHRMTLQEKLAQLGSVWSFMLLEGNRFAPERARPVLAHGLGHLTRPAGATSLRPREVARLTNQVQRFLTTQTRLGIPAIVHEEVCSGVMARESTIFPQAIGVASTWEPELNRRLADAVRAQMRATGSHQGLSAGVGRGPGSAVGTYRRDLRRGSTPGVADGRGLRAWPPR